MNKKEIIDYLLKERFEILIGNDNFNYFIMGEVYAEKRIELPDNNIFYVKFHKYNANGFLGNKPYICDYKKEFKWDINEKCEDFIIIRLFNSNTNKEEYKKVLYDGYDITDIDVIFNNISRDIINKISKPIELNEDYMKSLGYNLVSNPVFPYALYINKNDNLAIIYYKRGSNNGVIQIKRYGKNETLFGDYIYDINDIEKLTNELKINE